jgi:hypothetical protein
VKADLGYLAAMSEGLTAVEEEQWCAEQRDHVVSYLTRQGLQSPSVGDWPAWHVAPSIAVWAVESLKKPGSVGWWAISGDLPTDYTSCG